MSGRLFGYIKDAVHRELCSMLCGSLDGKGVWERMDICMCMAESLSGCPPEHITTLLTGYVLSHFSRVQLFATLWTVACQAPLSVGLSWQEYWSRLPRPPPGDLPDPGIEPPSPVAPALQVDFYH